jgi:hypothetical protein
LLHISGGGVVAAAAELGEGEITHLALYQAEVLC